MSKGICGYGRYDDDPEHVGCPRAKSAMTPCIARDGHTALSTPGVGSPDICVGCGVNPVKLLDELKAAGVEVADYVKGPRKITAANYLATVVRATTAVAEKLAAPDSW